MKAQLWYIVSFVLLSRNQTVKPVRKDQAADTLVNGTWTRIKERKTEVF